MDVLHVLVDYKGRFGSKWSATPYRSGLNRERIAKGLLDRGIETRYLGFSDVNFRRDNWRDRFVVYTSAEDSHLHYKGFIEDVLLGLELQGAVLIPRFPFFRAHHNKVFMEIMRDVLGTEEMRTLSSRYFGTLEEAASSRGDARWPQVIKPAAGSMSAGVMLAHTRAEFLARAASISRVWEPLAQLKDFVRKLRHKGYTPDSFHRRKFIAQDFVSGLTSDWKILVFGEHYYPLFRRVRPKDFRASGSGRFEYRTDIPTPVLDFAERVFRTLDVPFLSLDVGFTDNRAHLLEFQAIYFGTRTLDGAECHFERRSGRWTQCAGKAVLEDEWAMSVAAYVRRLTGASMWLSNSRHRYVGGNRCRWCSHAR